MPTSSDINTKGVVVSVMTASGPSVRFSVLSPTGDITDSFTYDIPCLTESQAEAVAETWRKVWNIV